ncbi:MAG: hypothetical protein FWB82_05680 [Treponema sp.]|nr:hypothetical protein [Treponema sp.]
MRNNHPRSFFAAAVKLAIAVSFFTVSAAAAEGRAAVEISERMFATHVNHINLNPFDYMGRTIRLEGIFVNYNAALGFNEPLYVVYRNFSDGCCVMRIGFEVQWPEGTARPPPADHSWVEVIGVIRMRGFIYIELTSLTVLNRRGAAVVSR